MSQLLNTIDPGVIMPVVDIVWSAFSRFFARFHWIYMLSALGFALLAWRYHLRTAPPGAPRPHFLKYLFPKEIWLHRSALLDMRFVMVDKILLAILVGLAGYLFASKGGGEKVAAVAEQAPLGILVAYTISLIVVEDLFRYWAHRLMHTNPYLWQFHKVHHSAEVLVPFSQMRTHPVNGLVNAIRSGLAIGLVTGVFMLIWPGKLTVLSILGINAGRFIFNILGSNLRHSHVWFSFGPVLSRILISPAQHQIHHSGLPQHINKNYGSQFALWDWMFGSLYVPKGREELKLGIGAAETAKLQSVKSLYIQPFKDVHAMIKSRRAKATAQAPAGAE